MFYLSAREDPNQDRELHTDPEPIDGCMMSP
jgi:hypothetical protein